MTRTATVSITIFWPRERLQLDGENGGEVADDGRAVVAGVGGRAELATGGDRSRWQVVLPF
jgi:hypothetical protein